MKSLYPNLLQAIILVGLCSCSKSPDANIAQIDDQVLANVESRPGDWIAHGRNQAEDRFSPLDQINASNVDDLGLAWGKKLGTTRGLEATPLVIDGIMYFTLTWSTVMAVDCENGETLWTYDPMVDKSVWGMRACCDVVNRGLAYYRGNLYLGSLDGRLIALDAQTGIVAWETQTFDTDRPYTITGAPRIFDGKVVIGNGGAERGVRGFISAYDALTGELAWKTYTVPGDPSLGFESPDMERAAETWKGEWWTVGGGGTCWDSFAYDPELKLLYVGTGNGSPWTRIARNGTWEPLDNLYLSSILALNPDTGRIVWYYQTTPGDNWDYTATQHMILADIEWKGSMRQVLMQAPKNGFFYVLDRKTGELLAADPFIEMNWAEGVDLETGRPIESPASDYSSAPKEVKPSQAGGHSWHPMSYNPEHQLVYIPVLENTRVFKHDPNWKYRPGKANHAMDIDTEPRKDVRRYQGGLIAWDPIERKRVWVVDHTSIINGGTLASAGDLVFQGNADGEIVAYEARTGERLWSYFTGTAIMAPPVTYLVNGVQYVSVVAGWGGGMGQRIPPGDKATEYFQEGILYTFKLDGEGERLELVKNPRANPTGPDLEFEVDVAKAAKGRDLYVHNCSRCHGPLDGRAGSIPDLTASPQAIHDVWQSIVHDGIFASVKGMPKFEGDLNREEISLIQHYVVRESRAVANRGN